ncbi:hypothetical protein N9L47_09865 [Rhodobacteraceae bacterium]|nr:hypothetical protein [Paracoccaceae bacterium]
MIAALATACALAIPAHAQDARITVELNKLEASETGSCRAFFLFKNGTEQTFEGFELSIAVLDTDGVINRLLSIDAAPLPVQRTTLKLFEIPEISCDRLSELIVHDIPACKPENADPTDCYGLVDWNSRTDVRLGQ